MRPLRRRYAFDQRRERAQAVAAESAARFGIAASTTMTLRAALDDSLIYVTCTPSHHAILAAADIHPGMFIAAVGADNPDKQEIASDLMGGARVWTDLAEQCAAIGDLHHAVKSGAMTRADVAGEIADLVTGAKAGRSDATEIAIFDSTGLANRDVAAATVVYRRRFRRRGMTLKARR
ncbi:MAG: hypothetical protein FJX52_07010 [Alphaproteobacteria bacterium]|nr:hypothetical protein [Alphaproteobacteria bacterium]